MKLFRQLNQYDHMKLPLVLHNDNYGPFKISL